MSRLSVVIGRFQVPALHLGHIHLLDYAASQGDKLLILIATTEAMPSRRNPLNFAVRQAMISQAYPEAFLLSLPDHPSDEEWSRQVDRLILENFPGWQASLFGSRDSFIPFYSGRFPTVFVEERAAPSGTESRQTIETGRCTTNESFRAGMIYAQSLRFPVSYQTVDIAVINQFDQTVLMGRKQKDGGKYRFIGGFVEPTDPSLEAAALRELREEAGSLDCHELTYLGSFRVRDYRYQGEADQIMTAFFLTYKLSGRVTAGDDLDEVAWIPIRECLAAVVGPHKSLAERLLASISNHNLDHE